MEDSCEEVVKPTWWCVACRDNGIIEIYTLPDFKLVFLVKNFNMAPRVLVDSGSTTAARYATMLLFKYYNATMQTFVSYVLF